MKLPVVLPIDLRVVGIDRTGSAVPHCDMQEHVLPHLMRSAEKEIGLAELAVTDRWAAVLAVAVVAAEQLSDS